VSNARALSFNWKWVHIAYSKAMVAIGCLPHLLFTHLPNQRLGMITSYYICISMGINKQQMGLMDGLRQLFRKNHCGMPLVLTGSQTAPSVECVQSYPSFHQFK
jgi:hypothetical protein